MLYNGKGSTVGYMQVMCDVIHIMLKCNTWKLCMKFFLKNDVYYFCNLEIKFWVYIMNGELWVCA